MTIHAFRRRIRIWALTLFRVRSIRLRYGVRPDEVR